MIIDNVKDLSVARDFINENEKMAFDIETNSLNPRTGKVVGFGCSNADKGFYIVHLRWNGSELEEVVPFEDCVEILNLLNTKNWVGWNSSFELRFCRGYFKVDLNKSFWSEAMLAKHTADEERPFQLKQVAKKLYGEDSIEEQKLMKDSIKENGGDPTSDYFMADSVLLGEYCIKDCLLTFRINEKYLQELDNQNLTKFFFDSEVMPMYSEVVIPMEEKGVRVDVSLLERYSEELGEDLEAQENLIMDKIEPLLGEFNKWYLNKEFPPKRTGLFAQYVCQYGRLDLPKTKTGKFSLIDKNLRKCGDNIYAKFLLGGPYLPDEAVDAIQNLWKEDHVVGHMFNLRSKDHLKRLFFEKLGEEPVSTTELGNPQVDNLFLTIVSDKYDWVKDLLVYNRLCKIQGTYIDRYHGAHEEGVFYPGWFMHRTTSGRLGGDLMQLPRKVKANKEHPLVVKYNNVIRDTIIAGEGRKLIGADYASLEVCVFADDSEDETLLSVVRNDEDFYSKTAIEIFDLQDKYSSVKSDDNYLKIKNEDIRQDSKEYALGIRYGMMSFKLGKILEISQDKAEDIIKGYFKTYPGLRIRMDKIIEFSKKFGYMKSKGGRVRHLGLLKKLEFSHGDVLGDSLKLWKKYHGCPAKYKQMKYLGKQYRSMINNSLNFPIQSMAATITNKACVAISREFKRIGLDAYVCMQIHDEIVVSCKEEDVVRVKKIMQFLMENTTKLSVPLSAKPEVGDRYGEIK